MLNLTQNVSVHFPLLKTSIYKEKSRGSVGSRSFLKLLSGQLRGRRLTSEFTDTEINQFVGVVTKKKKVSFV